MSDINFLHDVSHAITLAAIGVGAAFVLCAVFYAAVVAGAVIVRRRRRKLELVARLELEPAAEVTS